MKEKAREVYIMNWQKLPFRFLIFMLMAPAFAASSAPLARQSPEYSINEPSGKTTLLSSFKGKVVVLEFLFVKSQHCLRVAETLNKLHGELGPRGFQAVGVAFDPPNSPNSGAQLLAYVAGYLKLSYPVGYSAKADVDRYLGRTQNELLNIPQVVVIDRTGMIRAQSGGRGGNPGLEDENSLRRLIENLLKENAGGSTTK
ncbi:MAG TPA: TlpA disulfide reductase family protein [Candidatus Sulfotelmatobacter sp.]|jgi:peroxiredoxin|nr:TlpA disulfide reductase family protein [Candidatus Sulfotelmatobacter sp.]